MTTTAEYELRMQLFAGSIDSQAGIIRGATVGQAGVAATGKFLLLDAKGKRTSDPELAVRKIPIFTDSVTLDTLMAAASAGGGTFKIRSDHDDRLVSRAGHADNFKRIPESKDESGKIVPERVVADLNLNDSYRDRDIVLETSRKTPELIGLSIDMTPSFVIEKDRALMRIEDLTAVDIVDEGAITPGGMFLKRGVDKEVRVTGNEISPEQTTTLMADKNIDDCMSAIAALTKTVGDLAAQMAKPATPDKAAMSAATDEARVQLKADLDKELATVRDSIATMKQERAKLGLKSGEVTITTVDELETERARLAAERSKGDKNYLKLVAEKRADGKMSAYDAHRAVQKENKAAYLTHLSGLVKPESMRMAVA